jgi:hypothetical protein
MILCIFAILSTIYISYIFVDNVVKLKNQEPYIQPIDVFISGFFLIITLIWTFICISSHI